MAISHLTLPRRRVSPHSVLALAATLALIVLAKPALATRSASEPAPRFLLETITVEGVRTVSPAIIVSESLLRSGNSYDEAALREAIYRLRRLPFVLDARFALRRGSVRDHFELVITVEEARRGFFGAELTYNRYGDPLALEGPRRRDSAVGAQPLVGLRAPAGTYGVLFAAGSLEPEALQAGYTRYRLFGRPATLGFGYAYSPCCQVFLPSLGLDPTFSSWYSRDGAHRLHGELALPVTGNHSLQLAASLRHSEGGERQPVLADEGPAFRFRDRRDARLALSWRFDVTDDPLLPSRGFAWSATLEGQSLEADLADRTTGSDGPAPPFATSLQSQQLRFALAGRGHRSVAGHQTLGLEARLAAGRTWLEDLPLDGAGDEEGRMVNERFDVWEAFLAVEHSIDLVGWRQDGRRGGRGHAAGQWGEVRWETRLSVGYDGTFPNLGLERRALERLGLRTGIVWRNAWGIFRIGFTFEEITRTG